MNPNEKPLYKPNNGPKTYSNDDQNPDQHNLDDGEVAPFATQKYPQNRQSPPYLEPSADPQYPSFSQIKYQNPMNDPNNHARIPNEKPEKFRNQKNYQNQPPYPNQQYPQNPYPMPPSQQPHVYLAQSPLVMPNMPMPYFSMGGMPMYGPMMPMAGQPTTVVLPPGYQLDTDSGYSPFGNIGDELRSIF